MADTTAASATHEAQGKAPPSWDDVVVRAGRAAQDLIEFLRRFGLPLYVMCLEKQDPEYVPLRIRDVVTNDRGGVMVSFHSFRGKLTPRGPEDQTYNPVSFLDLTQMYRAPVQRICVGVERGAGRASIDCYMTHDLWIANARAADAFSRANRLVFSIFEESLGSLWRIHLPAYPPPAPPQAQSPSQG